MKHILRKGNIYKVQLEEGTVRFFQFIGKDSSNLYGDVIRIFRKHYRIEDKPVPDTIIADTIECYMHTTIHLGVKMKLWELYANSPEVGTEDIVFRSSQDVGKTPYQVYVSSNWTEWRMNHERVWVGDLPHEYVSASIGCVYSPKSVIKRLITGSTPDKYYPTFK
jgi:hypothetical protein